MAGEARHFVGWVKRQRCCAGERGRCQGGIEAHHAAIRSGLALRGHDRTCVPLCSLHHRNWHDASGVFREMRKPERHDWARAQMAVAAARYVAWCLGLPYTVPAEVFDRARHALAVDGGCDHDECPGDGYCVWRERVLLVLPDTTG